jgi:hypothetical protein
MNAFATQTPKFREQFFRQYQSEKGIDPVIAEKDFWVCWLLARIFEHPELAPTCLFKGGTSLSKVFHAIERFSEDIDLGITPESLGHPEKDLEDAPSRTQREQRNKLLEEACASTVQHVQFSISSGNPTGSSGARECAPLQCPECWWIFDASKPVSSFSSRVPQSAMDSPASRSPAGRLNSQQSTGTRNSSKTTSRRNAVSAT